MNDWFSEVIWNSYSIALTIEFGRCLLKLHRFTLLLEKKEGFISNWKLMIAHFGTLFTAALANTISLVLYSIHYFNDSYDKNSDLYLRLFITYNYAKVTVYTSWFIVHVLMLKIFITYGRAF